MFLWFSSVHKQVNKQVNVFTFFFFIRSNQKLQVSRHETYILINSAVTGITRCQTLLSPYLLYSLFLLKVSFYSCFRNELTNTSAALFYVAGSDWYRHQIRVRLQLSQHLLPVRGRSWASCWPAGPSGIKTSACSVNITDSHLYFKHID